MERDMDEERLISKKEVLEKMGISYGQLYRWKRKGLIPEAWFIRRSTFTGQETFFPRDKILERIARIVDMKDDHPLDDLAELITTRVNAKLRVALTKLERAGWLDDDLLRAFRPEERSEEAISIWQAFVLGVLSRLRKVARSEEVDLVRRTLEREQGKGLLDRVSENGLRLYLLRKRVASGGISAQISLVALADEGAVFDPEIEIVEQVELSTVLQRIKLDLARGEEAEGEPGVNDCSTESGEENERMEAEREVEQ
jgi:DNA-binding transcriptional MerR regulator